MDSWNAAIVVGRKLRMGGGFLNRKLSSAKSAEGENFTFDGERELHIQSSELQMAC